MNTTIFLDMDGVLVDFVGGAKLAHGKSHIPTSDITWDIVGVFDMTPEKFWAKCDYAFWAGLSWTDEGQQLLLALESLVPSDRIALMTSPCLTPGSVEGKVDWVRRNLPSYSRRLFVGPAKHLAAGPGKILIDDSIDNCKLFIAGGGRAILVPRPWNPSRDPKRNPSGKFDVDHVIKRVSELI